MSDSIKTACPNCFKGYRVSALSVGKNVRCRSCQHSFIVKSVNLHLNEESESPPTETQSPPPPLPSAKPKSNKTIVFVTAAVIFMILAGAGLWLIPKSPQKKAEGTSGQTAASVPSVEASEKLDDVEVKAFRSAVTKAVLFANLTVARFSKHASANDWMMDSVAHNSLSIMDEQRSRIPVPPRGIEFRELVQEQLDCLVSEMKEISKQVKEIRNKTKFDAANEALKYIYSGEVQLSDDVKSRLETIDRTASLIANELKITYEDAHGSDKFQKHAREFVEESHTLLKSLDEYKWPELLPRIDRLEFSLKWGFMVDPPKEMVEGKAIIQDFSGVFSSVLKAIRIIDCASEFDVVFNKKTKYVEELNKAFHQETQKAKQLLADAESRLAKSKPIQ